MDNSQQGATIARVKSQTRFTYSNQPVQGVAPTKFVLENSNKPSDSQKIQSPPPNSQFIQ